MEAAALSSGDNKAWKALSLVFVFWPAAIWSVGAIIAVTAILSGCEITARGPEECVRFGADIGELIYPLWSLGFFLPIVIIWVAVTSPIVELVRLSLRKFR